MIKPGCTFDEAVEFSKLVEQNQKAFGAEVTAIRNSGQVTAHSANVFSGFAFTQPDSTAHINAVQAHSSRRRQQTCFNCNLVTRQLPAPNSTNNGTKQRIGNQLPATTHPITQVSLIIE